MLVKMIAFTFCFIINSGTSIDPTSILLTGGGYPYPNQEEIIGQNKCNVPKIPTDYKYGHVMLLTAGDNKVLSCGGWGGPSSECLVLEPGRIWRHHSYLIRTRAYGVGISMPNGVYLFGGIDGPNADETLVTSDFLPAFGDKWEEGPVIPNPGIWAACGAKISDTELVLIGGYDSKEKVLKFNTETGLWTQLANLNQGRHTHSCAFLNGNIIVAGGFDEFLIVESTEIISITNGIPRLAEPMLVPRLYHSLITYVEDQKPKVLAIGGFNKVALSSIEVWNETEEIWNMSSISLDEPRMDFAALALPPNLICPYP